MRLTVSEKIFKDKGLEIGKIYANKQYIKEIYKKLSRLEDIEERLSKYKEIGINELIDLFENLTDEDIEYIVQLAFKKRKIIYDIRW